MQNTVILILGTLQVLPLIGEKPHIYICIYLYMYVHIYHKEPVCVCVCVFFLFCFCCLVFFVVGSLKDEPGRPVSE